MAHMTFAAIAAVMLLASGAHQADAGRALKGNCPVYTCPANYVYQDISTAELCGYYCQKPVMWNCPAGPARDPLACGGTTGKTCPVINCASSTAIAVSGPGGCAKASSAITAASFSQATYTGVFKSLELPIKEYCAGSDTPLYVYAQQIANAHAKSIAQTLTFYSQYVCTCCRGNSGAYSAVAADVKAVARATAEAAQAAVQQFGCYGEFAGVLSADAYALADATEMAIDTIYKEIYGIGTGKCTSDFGGNVETAIAEATVCTIVKLLAASAYYGQTDSTTYESGSTLYTWTCSDSVAMSGYPNTHSCDYNYC